MNEYFADSAALVHAATATYVLGFLFRNQFILRGLILIGTAFYILYYYFHTDEPLWDAIVGSVLIGTATIIGIGRILYSRIPTGMNQRDRELFEGLGGLEPGEFRDLMRIANRVECPRTTELTREGAIPRSLYYVISGCAVVEKGTASFRIGPHAFVGEVAFFLPVFLDIEEHEFVHLVVADDFPIANAEGRAVIGLGNVRAPVKGDLSLEWFSFESGKHAHTIDGAILGKRKAHDVENRGENIRADDGNVAGGSGFDVSGPAGDAGDANSSFMTAPFATAQPSGRSSEAGDRSVVGGEEEQGVVSRFGFVQGFHDLSQGVIELGDVAHVFGIFVPVVE